MTAYSFNIRHHIEEPAETDFYFSPEAKLIAMRSTVLLHPSIKDTVIEDLWKNVDSSKRAAWYDFKAVVPRSTTSVAMASTTMLLRNLCL